MKNINTTRILLLIILTCSAGAVVVQAQNYTVIMNYGQTPYQLGYLSQGNVTGWTWWDTDGGMQQKNLILVSIMENTTPVSGLSPPAWIQNSSEKNSGSYSWKAGEGIHSWHYLDDYSTSGTPLEDIVLSESQKTSGFLTKISNWLKQLITGVNPAAVEPMINLTFWTKYNMTDNYGFVKVSVDRGTTWDTLKEYSGNSSVWVKETVNLTKYDDQQILIAFYFRVNDNNDEEWWIDDIEVTSDGVTIFSDGAENPPPVLSVNVSYPHYDYLSDSFSNNITKVDLIEDYLHQIYYGVFNYPDDAYTGKYQVDFSTTIDTNDLQASTNFSTTLWGCQARGCHDSWSPASNSSERKPTVMIHPDNITSDLSGNCLAVCHSTYSSQFLRATPVHLHDLKYGHEGGFIYGESGWATIYNSTNANVQMYYKTSVKRPISQTQFNNSSHVTEAECIECHTNFIHDDTGTDEHLIANTDKLTGTNITSTGIHAINVTCEACHGIYNKTAGKGLYYPPFDTTTKQLTDSIGDYVPEFMSYEAVTKTYIINMSTSGTINVTVTGDDDEYGIFLSLIGPIEDASGLQDLNTADHWNGTYCVPSVNGTATFAKGSKIYFPSGDKFCGVTFDSSPKSGTWIARVFPRSSGTFNYTITSSHPIRQKPVIHIPWNCSECHNPNASGSLAGAQTYKPMPSWDNQGLSYTHTDYNSDGKDDVTCRLCHNSFHDISIKNCTDCHIQRPGGHNQADYSSMGYAGCIKECHKDPHFEPEAAAGGNCADCHLEDGANATAGLPIINRTGFFNSSHYNITGDFNASNYSEISMVCWGCHVNYTEQLIDPFHTRRKSELPDCEDCHLSETPLNGEHLIKIPPIQIPEHQPLGVDVQTNISTNCTFCHNNSLSIPIPTTNVTYAEAKNYVSHYVDTANLMTTTNNTTDCWWCHVDNSDNVSWGMPTNPFTSTYNHTPLNLINSIDCYPCHISNKVMDNDIPQAGFTFHNNSMLPGAGKYCVDCHDIGGMENETYQIDVQAMNRSGAIHYNLNRVAIDTMDPNQDPDNVRCWACHGDGNGSEAAQPTGHPDNYNTPKNCSNRECHNFNQSIFNEPMVYEHIRHVDEIDEHVTTTANCPLCHKNSIVSNQDNIIPNDTSLVSHYGSTWNLVNTPDCIYCHLDEDNAVKWGNAPDPRNHTHYTVVEKTLIAGRPWEIVDNYSITLIETTSNAAMFIFEKDGELLELDILSLGDELNFEISGIEDENTSIVNFTINKIFKGRNAYVVELSGDILASRIHRETDNIACYACHDREYRTNVPDGMDYYVLKKDIENVTLARMPVNFKTSEDKILSKGEYWDIGENFSLYIADVSLNQKNARLHLYRNGKLLKDDIISKGSNFTHEEEVLERDIDVFGAKLDCVFTGVTQAVTLTDVFLIAGDLLTFDSNTSILQTNTQLKYLTLDSIITIGKMPDNFHVNTITPGEYSLDCISCHCGDGVAPVKINLDTFKEGVHVNLNSNATYTGYITDKANMACWACHGNGSAGEFIDHPKPYLGDHTAKSCISCHGWSLFGAKQIYNHYSGAEISTDATCWDCHSNTYNYSTPNLQASASHYSTHDLLNTSKCSECHDNRINGIRWGEAPQVTKHNASNNCTLCHAGEGVTIFHDSGISITRGCENCHIDEQQAEKYNLTVIRTHYPGAPNESANTLKHNDYTCEVCHNVTNETLHTNLEVREYRNETLGFCFPCHSLEGNFPHKSETQLGTLRHGSGIKAISGCDACHTPEGVSKFHTPTYIGKSYFKGAAQHDVDCTACHKEHEERKYQPYEGIQCIDCHSEYGNAHYTGAAIEMADETTTCSLCHNEEADTFHNLTHIMGDVTDAAYEPCRKCHMDIEPLKIAKNRSLSIIGGTMSSIVSHPSVSNETDIIITCTSCHNAVGENKFHYDLNPLGTVQNPGWENWTIGNVTGCKDCHTYYGGQLPFNATNMGTTGLSPAGTAHGLAPGCTLCHGGADPISFHTLATTEFIPRLAVTLNPENVIRGESCYLEATVVLPPLTKVTQAEYFIDELTRDGYGILLEYVIGEAGDSSVIVGTMIDTDDLSLGNHLIYVHVKDSSGKWSKMEVAVLNVEKGGTFMIAEIILREIVPAVIIFGFLFFIWRRFK